MIVIDACVAVKALTDEPGSGQATALLGSRLAMIAPEILDLEVAAALAKKVRFAGLPLTIAATAYQNLSNILPDRAPDGPLIATAFSLSASLNHALYDCIYLALAMTEAGVVATSDAKFIAAATRGGYAAQVVDFKTVVP